jgi:hypothetical protein
MAEQPPPYPTPILPTMNVAMLTDATWRMTNTVVNAEAQNMADRRLTRFINIGNVNPAKVAPIYVADVLKAVVVVLRLKYSSNEGRMFRPFLKKVVRTYLKNWTSAACSHHGTIVAQCLENVSVDGNNSRGLSWVILTAEVTVAQSTSMANTVFDLGDTFGWHSRLACLPKLDCMIRENERFSMELLPPRRRLRTGF